MVMWWRESAFGFEQRVQRMVWSNWWYMHCENNWFTIWFPKNHGNLRYPPPPPMPPPPPRNKLLIRPYQGKHEQDLRLSRIHVRLDPLISTSSMAMELLNTEGIPSSSHGIFEDKLFLSQKKEQTTTGYTFSCSSCCCCCCCCWMCRRKTWRHGNDELYSESVGCDFWHLAKVLETICYRSSIQWWPRSNQEFWKNCLF